MRSRATVDVAKNTALLTRFLNELVDEVGRLNNRLSEGERNGGNGMQRRTAADDIRDAQRQKDNVLSGVQTGAAALVELGVDRIATAKSNLNGDGSPTTNDDVSKGYATGSIWIDQSVFPQEVWICALPTISAANWVQLG
jgi:hypothetical protein